MNLKSVVLTVLISLLAPSAALAGPTEIEKLEKRAKKIAVSRSEIFQKQKGLCVCLNDSQTNDIGALGVINAQIVQKGGLDRVEILCSVMRANPSDGTFNSAGGCTDWVPLAK